MPGASVCVCVCVCVCARARVWIHMCMCDAASQMYWSDRLIDIPHINIEYQQLVVFTVNMMEVSSWSSCIKTDC